MWHAKLLTAAMLSITSLLLTGCILITPPSVDDVAGVYAADDA